MTINVQIDETGTVELGRGIGTKEVNRSKRSPEDHQFIYAYGETQWINDGGSNAKKPGAAGVLDRLARAITGGFSTGAARVRVPAHIQEARSIVESELVKKGKAKNATVAGKMTRENLKSAHATVSRKNYDKFLDACRARVESRESVL